MTRLTRQCSSDRWTRTTVFLTAILAAVGGITLHVVHPPQDAAMAEALLLAAVHP